MTNNREKRYAALPASLPPRGLPREIAATYIGVSPSKFDQMVADGRMPKPILVDGRRIWDRFKIDRSFDALAEVDDDSTRWKNVTV